MKIIVTFGDKIIHETIRIYQAKMAYISLPKKRGEGYLKTPIGHHVNERAILIDDLNLYIEEQSRYWFAVRDSSDSKDRINNLLNELSKLHKTTYKIVGWNDFWNFIDNLNTKM